MADPVGSFLGFKIVVAGTEGIDVPRRWAVPGGLSIYTADREAVLNARLRPFTLDSIVSLCARLSIARLVHDAELRADLAQRHWDPDVTFLPMALRRVLTVAFKNREFPDQAARAMTVLDLKAACDSALDVVPGADMKASKDTDEIMSMALRILQAQYVDQLGHVQFMRDVMLTLRTIDHARVQGVDLDQAFREAFGCTFAEITFTSFAMFSAAAAHYDAQFNPRDLNLGSRIPGLSQGTIDAVWGLCSIAYEDFKARALDEQVNFPGYELYSLSPTALWPLVIRSDGNAVAPLAVDLMFRGPRAFFYDYQRALYGEARSLSIVHGAAGDVLEGYVGECLAAAVGDEFVHRASDVFDDASRKCDWVLMQRNDATLFEVKSAHVRLPPYLTKDRQLLKEEFSRSGGLADALVQLEDSAREIRAARTKVAKGTNLAGVLVVRGHHVGLNSPLVRGLLEEVLGERGVAEPILKVEIVNDFGLDMLVRFAATGRSISRLIHEKRKGLHQYSDIDHVIAERVPELPAHPLSESFAAASDGLLETFAPGITADLLERRADS